jgi:hypothetical protein
LKVGLNLMKKTALTTLATALILTSIPALTLADTTAPTASGAPVVGDPVNAKVSKEQAMDIAKKLIPLPSGFTLQSANYNGGSDDRGAWYLSFVKKEGDQMYGNINYAIDAMTGSLQNYNYYDNDPDRIVSFPPKVSLQAAKDISKAQLAKLLPDRVSQLKFNDLQEQSAKPQLGGDVRYGLRYDRVVNDVPFGQDGVYIVIDGNGHLTDISSTWTDKVTFEDTKGAISSEDAQKALLKLLKPTLNYQFLNQSGVPNKVPVVAYNLPIMYLNAKNGEVWSPGGFTESKWSDKPLTDKPLGAPPSGNRKLSKEEAVAQVKASFTLPADAKLQNASYSENTSEWIGQKSAVWNLSWLAGGADPDKIKSGGYYIWANVDSQTGEVFQYNVNGNQYDASGNLLSQKPVITRDAAKEKAIELVKKQLPYYTHQLFIEEQNSNLDPAVDPPSVYYNFHRVIDGITASYDNVSVTVDRVTGNISGYSANFSGIDYPQQKPKLMDEEKAKSLLLAQYQISLAYMLPYQNYPAGMGAEKYKLMIASGELSSSMDAVNKGPKEAKLVYQLTQKYSGEPYFLDAVTGQWRNANTGEIITLDKIKVSDLDGHWAAVPLQIMADYRAIDVVDGKVQPNKVITRGELIKMLVLSMNSGGPIYYGKERAATFSDVTAGSAYFPYVESAVDRRLVDRSEKFNPDQAVTREDLAQLIVRALGYKKLSQYTNVFNFNYSDAKQTKYQGEVAIVVGLGIMSLSEGKFHSTDVASRAQAAAAFYNFLKKRTELQDNIGRPYPMY